MRASGLEAAVMRKFAHLDMSSVDAAMLWSIEHVKTHFFPVGRSLSQQVESLLSRQIDLYPLYSARAFTRCEIIRHLDMTNCLKEGMSSSAYKNMLLFSSA